ncbi:MAG: TRAP-type transport system periplasmic protein [Clostridia bacterium]|jgi:tripartite ATP-independent transporter DctP family solute receptor|nr:TRAP-type transport system periplasmic protein [Clostridia bacterium]MDN5323151.1 TRAP-type transport system periplasmic protein [Clostridia bacterium]
MKSKKFVLAMVFLLSLVLIVGCSTQTKKEEPTQSEGKKEEPKKEETKKPRIIRAGIGLNDKHPQFKALEEFKKIVEEKTNGSVKVELYHSGQIGDDRTMMEALQLGTQEMTCPATAPIANFVKEFSIFDFPFIFPNEKVADMILDGPVGQELLDKLPEQGIIGLAYWENGYRQLTNDVRPVAKVEDFNGLKIRTMENQVHLDAFRALGANPTPMPFPELFTAMQQGTVDGQENPFATIYLQKFYEVQKYVSDTNHVYSPFVLMMSKKFWDESTPEEQKIFKEAAIATRDINRKLNREANSKYVEELEKTGMTLTRISDEDRAEMAKVVAPVIEKHKEKVGKEFADKFYKAIDEAIKATSN